MFSSKKDTQVLPISAIDNDQQQQQQPGNDYDVALNRSKKDNRMLLSRSAKNEIQIDRTIIEESIPQALRNKPLLDKILTEMSLHHRWVNLCFHSEEMPWPMRVLNLACTLIATLYILSIVFIFIRLDDGSWCGASSCGYSRRVRVVIFAAFFSAMVSKPISMISTWLIKHFLIRPTIGNTEYIPAKPPQINTNVFAAPKTQTKYIPVVESPSEPPHGERRVASPRAAGVRRGSKGGGGSVLDMLASHVVKEATEHEKLKEEVYKEREKEREVERHRRGSRTSVGGSPTNADNPTGRRGSKDGHGILDLLASHVVKEATEHEKLKEDVYKEREKEREMERQLRGSKDSVDGRGASVSPRNNGRRRRSRGSRSGSPQSSPRGNGTGPLALLAGHVAKKADEHDKLKEDVHEERDKEKRNNNARRRRGSRGSRDGTAELHGERRGSRDGAGALFMLASHIHNEQENLQQERESAKNQPPTSNETRRGRRRSRDSSMMPGGERDSSKKVATGPLFMLATHVHQEKEQIQKTRAEVEKDRTRNKKPRKRPSLLISQKSMKKIEQIKESGADSLVALEVTKLSLEAINFRTMLTEEDQSVFDDSWSSAAGTEMYLIGAEASGRSPSEIQSWMKNPRRVSKTDYAGALSKYLAHVQDSLRSEILSIRNKTLSVQDLRRRLIFLFLVDVMPRVQQKLLLAHADRDLTSVHHEPVSKFHKLLAWMVLFFGNVAMLIFVLGWAINIQSRGRLEAWLIAFALWAAADFLLIAPIGVFTQHLTVPSLIQPYLYNAQNVLLYLTDLYQRKMIVKYRVNTIKQIGAQQGQIAVAGEDAQVARDLLQGNDEETDDMDLLNGTHAFNAADYLFVSYRLARRLRQLVEARIILQYRNACPHFQYHHSSGPLWRLGQQDGDETSIYAQQQQRILKQREIELERRKREDKFLEAQEKAMNDDTKTNDPQHDGSSRARGIGALALLADHVNHEIDETSNQRQMRQSKQKNACSCFFGVFKVLSTLLIKFLELDPLLQDIFLDELLTFTVGVILYFHIYYLFAIQPVLVIVPILILACIISIIVRYHILYIRPLRYLSDQGVDNNTYRYYWSGNDVKMEDERPQQIENESQILKVGPPTSAVPEALQSAAADVKKKDEEKSPVSDAPAPVVADELLHTNDNASSTDTKAEEIVEKPVTELHSNDSIEEIDVTGSMKAPKVDTSRDTSEKDIEPSTVVETPIKEPEDSNVVAPVEETPVAVIEEKVNNESSFESPPAAMKESPKADSPVMTPYEDPMQEVEAEKDMIPHEEDTMLHLSGPLLTVTGVDSKSSNERSTTLVEESPSEKPSYQKKSLIEAAEDAGSGSKSSSMRFTRFRSPSENRSGSDHNFSPIANPSIEASNVNELRFERHNTASVGAGKEAQPKGDEIVPREFAAVTHEAPITANDEAEPSSSQVPSRRPSISRPTTAFGPDLESELLPSSPRTESMDPLLKVASRYMNVDVSAVENEHEYRIPPRNAGGDIEAGHTITPKEDYLMEILQHADDQLLDDREIAGEAGVIRDKEYLAAKIMHNSPDKSLMNDFVDHTLDQF